MLAQEQPPIEAVTLGRRRNASCVKDVPHQRGGDVDPELAQLADDP
jgi:hypothetical protein